MRICIISYHTSPLTPAGAGTSGGMNIFMAQLYGRLARKDHIDIFVHGREPTVALKHNLRVIYIPQSNHKTFAQEILNFYTQNKYDLIHTHYWLSGMVGQIVCKCAQIPWVHSFHTIEHLKGIIADKQRIDAEQEIIMTCDYLISPTLQEKYELRRINPKAIVFVIPHGVDTRQFKPSANGHKKLLFVGRVAPIKGLDVLIESLRLLNQDAELTVVGGASKDEHTYDSIQSYARGLKVNFIGRVPHGTLHKQYEATSLVIVPSFYESFGLVGLEAMSSARPVIGFDDTGLAETVGNKAGILVKRNKKNLARAIQYLLNNTHIGMEMGMYGRRKAQQFDWESIVCRYRKTYENIIEV